MDISKGETPPNHLLRIVKMRKLFGGVKALQDVTLNLRSGEVASLIGPNGAGKTTLFNVVTGHLQADGGEIFFGDHPITGLAPHQITELGIARTFQNIRLFAGLNILENVIVGQHTRHDSKLYDAFLGSQKDRSERQMMHEKAHALLDQLGLYRQRYDQPNSLPYADQRKLEIARALATQPTLLLLDEPTAGMDEISRRDIMDLVDAIRDDGITIWIIEHSMAVVMGISDHICVLDFGKKIAEGSPETIRNDDMVIEAYLGSSE